MKTKLKIKLATGIGALLITSSVNLMAQAATAEPQAVTESNARPAFKADARPRGDEHHNYVAVYHGGAVAQEASVKVNNAADWKSKSALGLSGGFKYGFVTKTSDELIAVALEIELLNTTLFDVYGTAKVGSGKTDKLDLYTTALMFNPILGFQLDGPVVPYVGCGLGGAYIIASGSKGRYGDYWKTHDALAMAVQGIAGVDFYVTKRWSIYTEYKYLGLIGPDFRDNGNSIKVDGILNNHLVTAGAKFYF
ncbi:MAG: outer membrane beta-barrel protein [Verrucomicrobiales bacterium]|jgi:opacity protein-like surface antigen|nr:outer membrane beta-barrel protein [Verrucomicrobiales bacterium]